MNRFRTFTLFTALFFTQLILSAQHAQHGMSDRYTQPNDPLVVENLTNWQDLKFGVIIHWGLYSQLGVVESWSICSEEEDWIGRDSTIRYEDYKRDYWGVIDTFNPVNFRPEEWAQLFKRAGMKYLVFTTKHHDGFCMFDTKFTDFSISKGVFRDNPRNNVAKEIFEAFRNENFKIGAYFSKPDWHSQYYWWDRYATPNRNNNYDIRKNPERWEKFKQYTYNQIEEIVRGDYGKIDLMWLDGGWVRPAREGDAERMGRAYKGEQDVDMPKIARMIRNYQPGMIIVDRSVPGEFENYVTPERGIPAEQLDYPWESCITLGLDWGYTPIDTTRLKSPAEVIAILAEVVAKGGNLLLGVGPMGDGSIHPEAVLRLEEIGKWLEKNGEAIYNTNSLSHYNEENIWFTSSKDGKKRYAIVLIGENETLPKKISWSINLPANKKGIKLLQNGKKLPYKIGDNRVEVNIPKNTDTSCGAFVIEL